MSPSGTPSAGSQGPAPQRVLACILCSQRKIRCDRKFPCANCTKSRAQCVPATLIRRPRKRRFPERVLLDRLRKYEDLLRQNRVSFEPLHHGGVGDKHSPAIAEDRGYDSDGPDFPTPSTGTRSERGPEAKNILQVMSQGLHDSDDDSDSSGGERRENVIKNAWEQSQENADHLLFGSRATTVDLSTLHPDPAQIFMLWQVYLNNVNPLLKVTHTPSLQERLINAASHVTDVHPVLEALMFSIYCTGILSLTTEECQTMFGSLKEELLTRYQFGCQQALLNSSFLRTSDRDCLTALYLYLISIRSNTVPQSLHSVLGVAVRIAQRMGIHSESALARCTVFEAEMRRRLWWSLTLLDSRTAQLSNAKTVTLDPTWDCNVPLNVSDSDLRVEMKEVPANHGQPSEALFAVVRGEVANFIRHTDSHLDFTTPALKPIAQHLRSASAPEGDELKQFEETIKNQYLRACDEDNALHFMTIWTTRSDLAKCRLLDHISSYSSSCVGWKASQRDNALSCALEILECDTKIMRSPLTKGFRWFRHFYFPFLAYVHIVQDLKRRPFGEQEHIWEVMGDNFDAWSDAVVMGGESPVLNMFANLILEGWQAIESAAVRCGETMTTPPRMISSLKALSAPTVTRIADNNVNNTGIHDSAMPMAATSFTHPSQPFVQNANATITPEMYLINNSVEVPFDAYAGNQLDWTSMGEWPGWGSF